MKCQNVYPYIGASLKCFILTFLIPLLISTYCIPVACIVVEDLVLNQISSDMSTSRSGNLNKLCPECDENCDYIYSSLDTICRVCATPLVIKDRNINTTERNNGSNNNTVAGRDESVLSHQLRELFELIGGEDLIEALRHSLDLTSPTRQINTDYLKLLGFNLFLCTNYITT